MGYYRRRRSYRYRRYWSSPPSASAQPKNSAAVDALLAEYGARYQARVQASRAVSLLSPDIKLVFFGLDPFKLKLVFNLYEREHGSGGRKYAEKTYADWRCGTVGMSGRVAERLVKLVPRVLSTEDKFGLVQKLWQNYQGKSTIHLTFHPDSNLDGLVEVLADRIEESLEKRIPESVKQSLSWLYDDDSRAIEECLKQLEDAESRLVGNSLLEHVEELKSAANGCLEHGNFTGHIRFNLPFAHVSIEVRNRRPGERTQPVMSNPEEKESQSGKELVPRKDDKVAISNPADLLGELVKDLPKKKVDELKGKAADELLRIQVKQTEQRVEREGVREKVGDTIQAARVLNMEDNAGYELKTEHISDSSKTTVTIKKNAVGQPDDSKKLSAKCFVATACYGDENHEAVQILRAFRDEVLQKFRAGRLFIAAYYRLGPHMAAFVAPRHHVRVFVKGVLDYIVQAVR